jgi:hypothetical protein
MPFHLQSPPGVRVVLHATVTNAAAGPAGLVVFWVGAATVATGLVWLIVAPDGSCVASDGSGGSGGCVRSGLSGQQVAALVTAGAGVAVMAGALLLAALPNASVTQAVGAADGPTRFASDAWRREPVWHATLEPTPAPATPWMLPILARSF